MFLLSERSKCKMRRRLMFLRAFLRAFLNLNPRGFYVFLEDQILGLAKVIY